MKKDPKNLKKSSVKLSREEREQLASKYQSWIDDQAGRMVSFMVMEINNGNYAIPILQAKEVIKTPSISLLPESPEYILGISTVRTTSVVMADLELKWSKKKSEESAPFTLVTELENCFMGLLLHQLPFTYTISGDSIQFASDILMDFTKDECYISGIFPLEKGWVYIVDLNEMIKQDLKELFQSEEN